MDDSRLSRCGHGFTLIELVVVVAVVAILLFVAVPGMQNMIRSSEARTQAGLLMSSIQLTRSEAILRSSQVNMCPTLHPLAAVPLCSGDYSDGWFIFTDADGDRVVDVGIDQIIRVHQGMPEGYSLTNRTGTLAAKEAITYRSDGSSRRNRTLMICPQPGSTISSWSVVMNRVGRPRLARDWGVCPSS